MKEYKVGQIVTINGVKTRVTKVSNILFSCSECIFGGNGCEGYECRRRHRSDDNWIIFKPIPPNHKASNKQSIVAAPKHGNSTLDESKQPEFLLPPENMRVWIRGNKERGKDVIKMLTDLGAENPSNYLGDDVNTIYSIDKYNRINWLDIHSNTASLIANFYKEINLPWKPKDKELVWCWNASIPYGKCLRFYDEKNNCTFDTSNGSRDYSGFYHYAPYEGEYPQWAKEAKSKLEE